MSVNKGGQLIHIVNHPTPIEHKTDKTLIESIESAGIEMHFHCRQGFCGACRTKLIDGEVEYSIDPLAFIDDNEILPCCCYPKTDLTIKLDC